MENGIDELFFRAKCADVENGQGTTVGERTFNRYTLIESVRWIAGESWYYTK